MGVGVLRARAGCGARRRHVGLPHPRPSRLDRAKDCPHRLPAALRVESRLVEGAVCAHSLAEALQQCQDQPDAWVIGGAELYAQALPLAASAHVTEIDAPFQGDAYAPELDASWAETARLPQVSANGLTFSFVTYQKHPGA